jgi:hypothetical protein
MTKITILAVTRLSTGVCVAGITEDGQWIRPTRPNINDSWRQLEFDDCKDVNGQWIVKKGNIVRMDLVRAVPLGNHSEDWIVGSNKPELLREISESEFRKFCEAHSENSLKYLEGNKVERSLAMIHPDKICSFYFGPDVWKTEKYIPRCTFRLGSHRYSDIGVTDAEWRGLGRIINIKTKSKSCQVSAKDLFEALGTKSCHLTIGRYEVKSTIYLLVIGVHLFPVRHFDMDFER